MPIPAAEAATVTDTMVTTVKTSNTTSKKSETRSKSRTAAKLSKAERQRARARRAVEVAKKHIGDPYRWGANGPHVFDCSGIVQFAWRKAGVKIPRTTWSQRSGIKKKISWNDLKPGDLIFTSGGGHVGMYVGHHKMIHSPHTGARVRIDKLDSYRKRTFVGAVRPGF